uniref:Uncharacterized protein n=1 Tax=Fibrocapsa japonica TaxID=94617 RepID=A0A7S2V163_9STRA|mmetsp:Transcript_23224/g.33757  ORF Transcript_23224/g.33757 Transcript_23224/m.33757 type:complete len:221 (+) Transcript_23224:77-739(+)
MESSSGVLKFLENTLQLPIQKDIDLAAKRSTFEVMPGSEKEGISQLPDVLQERMNGPAGVAGGLFDASERMYMHEMDQMKKMGVLAREEQERREIAAFRMKAAKVALPAESRTAPAKPISTPDPGEALPAKDPAPVIALDIKLKKRKVSKEKKKKHKKKAKKGHKHDEKLKKDDEAPETKSGTSCKKSNNTDSDKDGPLLGLVAYSSDDSDNEINDKSKA